MSGTNIEVGYGLAKGADSFSVGLEAARIAAAGIKEFTVSVVLVFASARYNLEEMLKGVNHVVGGAPIIGTTTAGEICNGAVDDSVVVLKLASPYLNVAVGIGENVSSDWENAVKQAVGTPELVPYFASDSTAVHKKLTIEGKQAFGLLFSPGTTRHSDSRSFEILEKLKELSENRLPIFGASSADDWHMDRNFVLHGGKAYHDSLLVAVFETSLQLGMALYHGFAPGSEQAAVTKAEGHEVLELNGQPAAGVFAGLLGTQVEALERKHLTLTSGRLIGVLDPYGQYSVKVASYFTPGSGIRLSQPVSQGTALTLMQSEPESLVCAGKEAFRKALLRGNVENPAAVILFSCAVRQKLLGERIGEEISNVMEMAPSVPVAGFYSFGEQGLADDGINRHNNGVITTLVIGKDLSYAARVASENSVLRQKLEQSIASLKEQKEIAREAERKYRAIFENAREGIYQSTSDGRYLSVNPAMARIYGYASPEEMIATIQSIDREIFVIPDKWEELKQLLATESETGDFEVEQRRKDGSTFWASLRVHAVYGEDGRTLHWEGRCIDITERRNTEQALYESERTLRTTLKTANEGFWLIDNDTVTVEINPMMSAILGRNREEVIGRSIFEFVDDENRATFEQQIRSRAKGEIGSYEIALSRPDGSNVFCQFNAAPFYDSSGIKVGSFAMVADITERKRAEDNLRESEEKFSLAFHHAPVAAAISVLEDGTYLDVNDKFMELGGFKREEVLGKTSIEIGWLRPGDRRRVIEMLQKNGGVTEVEITSYAKDGTPVICLYYSNFVTIGGTKRLLTFVLDITDRKRAEEERKSLQVRLQRAEKMEALGTLAGGVAHDLNNVLGVVVGYSELLLNDSRGSTSARSMATEILKGGQRAAAIVQDLLTLARRGVQSRTTLNLNKIVLECLDSPGFFNVLSYHPALAVKSDLEADLLNVSGSAVHLEKCFMNLVSNAAEAMPSGGFLTIKTRNQYLDKAVSGYDQVKEGDYVVLSISDTGEGISAADLRRIFEPFYTRKVMGRSGTGLGLAVVWGAVKDHHGYINVQSEVGRGTTFTLYFPATREEIARKEVSISAAGYMGKGESILVVDDVKEQRELAGTMLRKINYSVEEVSSGEEAVEYLKDHQVDLLVLDMIMDPGMDGLSTYTKILELHPGQKAIIVSGFSETDRVAKALALGAGSYVKKPYLLEKLGLAVKNELSRQTTEFPV